MSNLKCHYTVSGDHYCVMENNLIDPLVKASKVGYQRIHSNKTNVGLNQTCDTCAKGNIQVVEHKPLRTKNVLTKKRVVLAEVSSDESTSDEEEEDDDDELVTSDESVVRVVKKTTPVVVTKKKQPQVKLKTSDIVKKL